MGGKMNKKQLVNFIENNWDETKAIRIEKRLGECYHVEVAK